MQIVCEAAQKNFEDYKRVFEQAKEQYLNDLRKLREQIDLEIKQQL